MASDYNSYDMEAPPLAKAAKHHIASECHRSQENDPEDTEDGNFTLIP